MSHQLNAQVLTLLAATDEWSRNARAVFTVANRANTTPSADAQSSAARRLPGRDFAGRDKENQIAAKRLLDEGARRQQ